MRRTFAQVTTLVVVMAISFQDFTYAETPLAEVEAVETEATLEKEPPLFRHSTYPAAWTAAQKSNRPILVYVSMPNCPHCVKMVKKTYELPEVGNLVTSSFETVYADRFTHAKLIQMLDVKWYPTTILVGPNNKVLDVIEGYVDSKTFQRRLQTGLAAASPTTQTR